MEDEEEELLYLRIQALKSSATRTSIVTNTDHSKSKTAHSNHLPDAKNTNQTGSVNTTHIKDLTFLGEYPLQPCQTRNEDDVSLKGLNSPNDQSSELKLRQQALMSLLQNRVVKTSELIKKKSEVVQTHKVKKPTRLNIKVIGTIRKKQTDSLEQKKPDKNDINSPIHKGEAEHNLEPNFKDEVLFDCDLPHAFVKKVSVGSEDEISLCASDEDENQASKEKHEISATWISTASAGGVIVSETMADVQCNIVSCSQEVKNLNLEVIGSSVTNFQATYQETGQDKQTQILNNNVDQLSKTFNNIPHSSLDETHLQYSNFNFCDTTSKHVKTCDFSSEACTDKLDQHTECKPGPSSYQPAGIGDSDSDDSIILLPMPVRSVPTFIEISDSDEDSNNSKLKRKKKKTLRDVLNKQLNMSGSRDDLKDKSCSICLGPFENRAFLEECFHSFCYICIIQWAELSRLCPLCKVRYDALVHSVTKDLEYERFTFPRDEQATSKKKQTVRQIGEAMEDGRRFRYRSTMVDTETWNIRRAQREQAEIERSRTREQRKMNRRLKWSATKDRRKAVYRMKMTIRTVKQSGREKYRDISPKFFCENPAMKHRLVPWLLRDLSVLLGDDDENIRFVMSLILNLISKTAMGGEEFNEQLKPFLFDETHHFAHELVSFASSPYDIRGYDDNVVYDIPVPSDDNTSIPAGQFVPDENNIAERALRDIFLGIDDVEGPDTLPHMDMEEIPSARWCGSPLINNTDTVNALETVEELTGESVSEVMDTTQRHDETTKKTGKTKGVTRIKKTQVTDDVHEDTLSERQNCSHGDDVVEEGEDDENENTKTCEAESNVEVDITRSAASDVEADQRTRKRKKKHKHRKSKKRKCEDDEAPKKRKKHKKKRSKHDERDGEQPRKQHKDGESVDSSSRRKHGEKKKKSKHKRERSSSCGEKGAKHSHDAMCKSRSKKKKRKSRKKRVKPNSFSSHPSETHSQNLVFSEERSSCNGELCAIKLAPASSECSLSVRHDGELIKDSANLKTRAEVIKTRAEVIKELLLIDEAIANRRKEKKKLKARRFKRKVSGNDKKSIKTGKEVDKNEKKSRKDGKTYLKLVKELQEIEGKINNCRSSLESCPLLL